MEDRRKINQQHKHKDKQRNAKPNAKSSSTQNPTLTSARRHLQPDLDDSNESNFAKRSLTSNWGKYELAPLDADEDNQQLSAADFEMLLLAPKSVGSHFVFSNEKSWNTDPEEATASDQILLGGQHFRFNLVEFEQQMATIPFYKRQDYDADLFSAKEVEDMNRSASLMPRPDAQISDSGEKYMLQSNALKLLSLLKSNNKEVNSDVACAENANAAFLVDSSSVATDNTVDELDALLDLAITEPISPIPIASVINMATSTNSTNAPADDIQKWLDDILED